MFCNTLYLILRSYVQLFTTQYFLHAVKQASIYYRSFYMLNMYIELGCFEDLRHFNIISVKL